LGISLTYNDFENCGNCIICSSNSTDINHYRWSDHYWTSSGKRPSTRSEIRQWLGAGGGESGQNSQEEISSSSPPPAMEEGIIVSIVGNSGRNSYNPNPIEIKVGDTMTWINSDSSPHTVTSSSNDGSITFDSDVLRRGETFSFTFDKEGQYPYLCTLHPSMVGTVVVTAS
jgi:plastocyanin